MPGVDNARWPQGWALTTNEAATRRIGAHGQPGGTCVIAQIGTEGGTTSTDGLRNAWVTVHGHPSKPI